MYGLRIAMRRSQVYSQSPMSGRKAVTCFFDRPSCGIRLVRDASGGQPCVMKRQKSCGASESWGQLGWGKASPADRAPPATTPSPPPRPRPETRRSAVRPRTANGARHHQLTTEEPHPNPPTTNLISKPQSDIRMRMPQPQMPAVDAHRIDREDALPTVEDTAERMIGRCFGTAGVSDARGRLQSPRPCSPGEL
jgi:hypothetical protein